MRYVRTAGTTVAPLLLAAGGIVATVACVEAPPGEPGPPAEPASIAVALAGVPTMGYPSYEERLQLVAQNRGRADPNNVALGTAGSCSVSLPAQPPLVYDFDGGQGARFHC